MMLKLLIKNVYYFMEVLLNSVILSGYGFFNNHKENTVIVGWYGTETIGDIAILAGVCDIVRKNNVPIYVVTLDEYTTEETKLNNFDLFSDVEFIPVCKAKIVMNKETSLVFGGGPIMTIHSILPIFSIWMASFATGRERLILGCGLGPFNDKYLKYYLSILLKTSTKILLRDELSSEIARMMVSKKKEVKTLVCPAVVYLENFKYDHKPVSRVINLALRQYPWSQYNHTVPKIQNLQIIKKFEKELKSFLNSELKDDEHIKIRPLPMCTNNYGCNDIMYMRELLLDFPDDRIDWSFCLKELTLDAYVKAFSEGYLNLCMRYHSVVIANELSTPVIAIDYTEGRGKIYSYCKDYSFPSLKFSDVSADSLGKVKNMAFLQKNTEHKVDWGREYRGLLNAK